MLQDGERGALALACALLFGERTPKDLACAMATKVRIERRETFIAFN